MIASLAGCLTQRAVDRVVVEVGGVGYLLHVSLQTLSRLPEVGQPVSLLCHTHVREDALSLFGFADEREKTAFELLKAVSGVGPKLALTILSGLPVEQLRDALVSADHRRLQAIPGIGKKSAERLVVELKDRFAALAAKADEAQASAGRSAGGLGDLADALVGLGYKRPLAERALRQASEDAEDLPAELLLRKALALIQEM